jgi:hypothetical protein
MSAALPSRLSCAVAAKRRSVQYADPRNLGRALLEWCRQLAHNPVKKRSSSIAGNSGRSHFHGRRRGFFTWLFDAVPGAAQHLILEDVGVLVERIIPGCGRTRRSAARDHLIEFKPRPVVLVEGNCHRSHHSGMLTSEDHRRLTGWCIRLAKPKSKDVAAVTHYRHLFFPPALKTTAPRHRPRTKHFLRKRCSRGWGKSSRPAKERRAYSRQKFLKRSTASSSSQRCAGCFVLDVLVPEVSLQRTSVVASVRQSIAARVPQHVRVDGERHLCPLPNAGKQGVKALRCQRPGTLG